MVLNLWVVIPTEVIYQITMTIANNSRITMMKSQGYNFIVGGHQQHEELY